MFTGIVEEVGRIKETTANAGRAGHIWVTAAKVAAGTSVGDSISISGACQTVVEVGAGAFKVEVMPETIRLTTLGQLRPGSFVNIERALAMGDRLGGHIVTGHVDAVGTVRRVEREENAVVFEVGMQDELGRYIVSKGSISVDGISLTVVEKGPVSFSVSIIPHTLDETNLGRLGPGSMVNLEVDVIAKYVESLLGVGGRPAGVERALRESGFMAED